MSEAPAQPDRLSAQGSEPEFDALLERVLLDDKTAWQELAAAIHRQVLLVCRRRGYGRSPGERDAGSEVALRVLERMRADDFAAIRGFVATRSKYVKSKFTRWLGVLVHNVYIDYIRAQPEVTRQRRDGARKLVRTEFSSTDVDSFASKESEITRVVEVRRLLLLLEHTDFPPVGRKGILLWLEGHSLDEIAIELGLGGAPDSRRVLHAARQRLRRMVSRLPNEQEVLV